jgi:acetyltransferase
LDDLLPSFWSHANPVDVLGDADTARFIKALECVTTDPGNDAVLAVISPQAMTDVKSISYGLRDSAAHSAKPVLGSLIGGASVAAGRAILNCGRIPTFDSPDAASRTFALASRHAAEIHQLCEVTEENGRPWAGVKAARAIADTAIKAARETGRTALNATEACNVLRAYGLPVIDATIASTEDEAICLAEKVGFPVAVKLQSPKILHKADVGGVVLNVANPDEVRRAWRKIRDNVAAAGSEAFAGVTIQSMAQTSSVELIFGSTMDSQFGPTILFGAGGKWVEVMQDTVIGLPPLNRTLARRLMEHTRVFGALKGARGEKPADLRALESALVNFAELVVREPDLAEIDINPVLIVDGQPIAVDARMILRDKDADIDRLPSPAIRPYPIENVFPQQLKNRTTVLLRPVRAEDESLMAEFHQNLSDRSVYFRYFMPLRLEQRIEHERLCRRCCVDYDRELGLIAEHPSTDGERRIVGVGRLTRIRSTKAAEFALLVADKWQGQGLGEALLERLVAIGKKEKLDQITGVILEENHAMRRLAEKMGFTMQHSSGECVASKTL